MQLSYYENLLLVRITNKLINNNITNYCFASLDGNIEMNLKNIPSLENINGKELNISKTFYIGQKVKTNQ